MREILRTAGDIFFRKFQDYVSADSESSADVVPLAEEDGKNPYAAPPAMTDELSDERRTQLKKRAVTGASLLGLGMGAGVALGAVSVFKAEEYFLNQDEFDPRSLSSGTYGVEHGFVDCEDGVMVATEQGELQAVEYDFFAIPECMAQCDTQADAVRYYPSSDVAECNFLTIAEATPEVGSSEN